MIFSSHVALIILAQEAFAGALTDGPGDMHGNAGVITTITSISESLIESGTNVGSRTYNQTQIAFYGEFSPIKFVSVAFSVPYQMEKYVFTDISLMSFDPQSKTGSYINSTPTEDLERSGAGMTGATIGINFYPYHNRLFEQRSDRGAWKLGLHYRFGTGNHFFTTNDQGQRGAGGGSSAWIFSGTFAVPSKLGTPYSSLEATYSNPWTGSIRDEDGTERIPEATIRAPSRVLLRLGNEITLWEDTAFAHFVELDLYGKAAYTSWSDIPTGLLLPNTLKSYSNYVVNQSENLQLLGGIGTNLQYNSYYHARLGFEMGMISPQYIENLYPVGTNGSVIWSVTLDFRFRYRTTAS